MENKVRQDRSRRKADPQASRYCGEPRSPGRPLRALFQHLNQPEPSAYGRQRITEHAATSMRVIQLGLSAIGSLLAQSAVQVEEHTIPAESVENLGRLMAELGELAALCHDLCRGAEAETGPITVQERCE